MGYQLPEGGGPKNDKELDPLVTTVLSLVGVVAFFVSPLGGIFFAITNSLFVLALLIPVTAVVAFQGWQFFNTVTGPCPECGAPVQVVKGDTKGVNVEPSPSICLNCGSVVQANAANNGIDWAGTGPGVVGDDDDDAANSLLNMLFGNNGGGGGGVPQRRSSDSDNRSGGGGSSSSSAPKRAEERYRREATIIDIDVQADDDDDDNDSGNKPFQ
jgi:hypothetical protein